MIGYPDHALFSTAEYAPITTQVRNGYFICLEIYDTYP